MYTTTYTSSLSPHTHTPSHPHTVNNPVIQLDQDMLVAQARSLGTPVNSFLTGNNFTEVSPDGVNTPPPEPYGGGAMSTVASLAVLLLATVLAISL